ncbi:nicotinate-nucleotide--dimethylbenzimidazole phosphoribosyltransferase [Uliginosibacterium silvisoli]|uniref:nicotinate-nucleotide--dimethylbenzimidazole phosphoribosyltransferase n=1 Tax=Uliginosibacterium silvisoli TaxID=3114758 RepID=UPI003A7F2BAC
MKFSIHPLDRTLAATVQARLDSRTKPQGSLGRLERLALQVALIQRRERPELKSPRIVVFAGDHGAANAGVSAFPQAVTVQMVANFRAGGAAINVLAHQSGLAMSVVDAGVASSCFGPDRSEVEFIDAKVARGTANFIEEAAMTATQREAAISAGAELVHKWHGAGCNAIGFGEMGIGNTASASLITHALADIPLADVVGPGTGLDDAGVARKRELLSQAVARVAGRSLSPLDVLAEFGGFEIAMMTGAFLAAAELGMLIVVDGFITNAALLVAHALHPAVLDYCVFAHCSAEPGHRRQMAYLGVQPLLELELRLGEGTGAALAFPLIRSALALMNEMAGFADAGVSNKST